MASVQVLPVRSGFKTISRLSIAVERGGKKTSLDYDIGDAVIRT